MDSGLERRTEYRQCDRFIAAQSGYFLHAAPDQRVDSGDAGLFRLILAARCLLQLKYNLTKLTDMAIDGFQTMPC